MLAFVFAASLAVPQGPAGVVINEISYADTATDDHEFVEIYNAASAAVDIDGWQLVGLDQGGTHLAFTIRRSTALQPGEFFVLGANTLPLVDQTLIDPGTGTSNDLFENGPHDAIELRDAQGNRIDRVDYATFGSTWSPAGLEGDGCPGRYLAVDGHEASLQRMTDGLDTDDNGADFLYLPWSPGRSNAVRDSLPYVNFFDAGPLNAPITDFGASFAPARYVDPLSVLPPNPRSIQPSPQGGNASIHFDQSGGGTTNMLITEPVRDVILEVYAYFDTRPYNASTDAESWSIGVRGTCDAYGDHPIVDPAFHTATGTNPGDFKTGLTGIAWVYQRTSQYDTLWLVDWGNGGDDFVVLGTVPIQAGVNDGWQRLKIRVADDRIEADFGGRYRRDDGTHFSAVTSHVRAGGVYMAYRELLQNTADWRPLTIDHLTVLPTAGDVRITGTGSMHSTGVPGASVNSLPYVGSSRFAVLGDTLGANAPGVLLFGNDLAASPIDLAVLGAPTGSLVYIEAPYTALVVSDANGDARIPLPIPSSRDLAGAPLEFQFVTADFALSNPLQIATSNAVGVTIAN